MIDLVIWGKKTKNVQTFQLNTHKSRLKWATSGEMLVDSKIKLQKLQLQLTGLTFRKIQLFTLLLRDIWEDFLFYLDRVWIAVSSSCMTSCQAKLTTFWLKLSVTSIQTQEWYQLFHLDRKSYISSFQTNKSNTNTNKNGSKTSNPNPCKVGTFDEILHIQQIRSNINIHVESWCVIW